MNKWLTICEQCENGGCSWVFSELKADAVATLRQALKEIHYEKGEMIYREGVPSHGAYIVCAGRVKVFERSAKGKKLILKLVAPGELLGEESLFGSDVCLVSAQALEPTKVKFISRADFLALMQRYPSVTVKLLEKLAQEMKAFRCKLLEVVYGSGKQKMVRLLLALEEKYGSEDGLGSPLRTRLSRSDLAEMAGLSTETTIRLLSELESHGLIRCQASRIALLDREALRQLSEPIPVALRENLV